MFPRLLAGLALAATLAAPLPALAQRFVSLSYSQLGLGIATRVTDLGLDTLGRTWVTTNEGVTAVENGDSRATFFPFRANDGLLNNEVRAVTFGKVGSSDAESFFLGFSSGIQWGRILNGIDLGDDLVVGTPTDARNSVNELAADRSGTPISPTARRRLWAATAGGLVAWDIGGQAPGANPDSVLTAVAPITHVVASPPAWGEDLAAVASSGRDLYLVRAQDSNPSSFFTTTGAGNTVADLTFDGDGNLWLLTTGRDVIRFDVAFDTAPPNQGSFLQPNPFRFDNALRTANSLAVDSFTGTVWLGTDLGAYFQTPLTGNLASRVCGAADTPGIGCWALDSTPNFTQADRVDEVLADASGNTWFGTSRGLKGRVFRLLSLDQDTYLGPGATAVVSLEDLLTFAGNGIPGEPIPDPAAGETPVPRITITVRTVTQTLTGEELDDTGRFTFTVPLANIGPLPASGEKVPVSVSYTFRDANLANRTLPPRTAIWANIAPFEDDAWIGGPCFLEALGR